jgi:hypothetical protein
MPKIRIVPRGTVGPLGVNREFMFHMGGHVMHGNRDDAHLVKGKDEVIEMV